VLFRVVLFLLECIYGYFGESILVPIGKVSGSLAGHTFHSVCSNNQSFCGADGRCGILTGIRNHRTVRRYVIVLRSAEFSPSPKRQVDYHLSYLTDFYSVDK
jgi:hypothetical protein